MLDALHARIDEAFAAARSAQPDALACRAGCHRCCHADLTLFHVEAVRLAAAFRALPAAIRRAAAGRAARGEHCALLDPLSHRCLVHAARPLVCHAFGLATLFEGEVSWCPKNYRKAAPAPGQVLDLSRLTAPLVVWERLQARGRPGAPPRVRVSQVAAGWEPVSACASEPAVRSAGPAPRR